MKYFIGLIAVILLTCSIDVYSQEYAYDTVIVKREIIDTIEVPDAKHNLMSIAVGLGKRNNVNSITMFAFRYKHIGINISEGNGKDYLPTPNINHEYELISGTKVKYYARGRDYLLDVFFNDFYTLSPYISFGFGTIEYVEFEYPKKSKVSYLKGRGYDINLAYGAGISCNPYKFTHFEINYNNNTYLSFLIGFNFGYFIWGD